MKVDGRRRRQEKQEQKFSNAQTINKEMQFNLHKLRIPALSIVNSSQKFEVHRIYCIGRNYREHAIEMGHDPDREEPFFFQKPPDAAFSTTITSQVPYPSATHDLHHEAELIVALKDGGSNISIEEASSCIFGYALGCDLTRRDLQSKAKGMRRPWDTAKGFDFSAPCGDIWPKKDPSSTSTDDLKGCSLECRVDGSLRQKADCTNLMIWSIEETISTLSKYFQLSSGDLIMTGTPAGVSSLEIGNKVEITCGPLPECSFSMAERGIN